MPHTSFRSATPDPSILVFLSHLPEPVVALEVVELLPHVDRRGRLVYVESQLDVRLHKGTLLLISGCLAVLVQITLDPGRVDELSLWACLSPSRHYFLQSR